VLRLTCCVHLVSFVSSLSIHSQQHQLFQVGFQLVQPIEAGKLCGSALICLVSSTDWVSKSSTTLYHRDLSTIFTIFFALFAALVLVADDTSDTLMDSRKHPLTPLLPSIVSHREWMASSSFSQVHSYRPAESSGIRSLQCNFKSQFVR